MRAKIYVMPQEGLKVTDGLGSFFAQTPQLVERTPFIVRKLRTGSLIQCNARGKAQALDANGSGAQ